MAKRSAALLPFRLRDGAAEVLLVHPGGPLWAKRDEGAWSLPKGEYTEEEDALAAARREFTEETGFTASGDFLPLGSVTQKGGKVVTAWAIRFDADPALLRPHTIRVAWPPKSGRMLEIPEVDRAAWFGLDAARRALLPAQVPFIDRLAALTAKT